LSDRELVSGVRVGDVLAGKYRVDRVLGVGGMGVVVAAHHLQLETRVAIKFLATQMVQVPEAVARFEREARAAVRIASEHVARVLDVGTLESGSPYMVMEFLDGADLSTRLKESGPLPIPEAVELLLQACEAIAEAHTLGIVHRDLKPANLFCTIRPDGLPCVKVLDFGISKVTSVRGSTPDVAMTRTAALMGTPLYMSPEQMTSSRTVDSRTDIWALGVILHEVLTGTSPFIGETLPEVCMRIATLAPPRLRSVRPDAPQEIELAILTCLEKDRERRFRSVAELAMAVAPFGPDRGRHSIDRIVRTFQRANAGSTALAVDTTGLAPDSGPPPSTETFAALGYTRPGRQSGRRVALALAAIVGVALLTVVASLFAGRFAGKSERETASASAVTAPTAGRVDPPPVQAPAANLPPAQAPAVPSAAVQDEIAAQAPPIDRGSELRDGPAAAPSQTASRWSPRRRPSPAASGTAVPSPPPAGQGVKDPFSALKPM
jgi:serine/threonine-protein kinase